MRILLCVNRDLMANWALNHLWPALQGHVVEIVVSDGVGKSAPKAPEIVAWGRYEQRLMETHLFPRLEAEGAADGRFKSFAQMAEATRSGALLQFASVNRDEGLRFVQDFRPDVIVSMRFGQIFKAPVIDVPPRGILNLHSGVLPAYRGILATFWAMLRGERDIGCTLHFVSDGTIDTGGIIGVHRLPADRSRSLLWNVASLYAGGTAMIASALARLVGGQTLETVPQDASASGCYSYPQDEAMAAFTASGARLYTAQDYRALFQAYGVADELPT